MRITNTKGVVWDLDGTLLDSFGIFEQIIADVVKESGHTMPTREYMLRNYHGSLEKTVQRILGIRSAEELDNILSTFLKKQKRYYRGNLETHLFKDATMLAQQAAKRGIHQILVTNRFHEDRGNASPKHIIANTVLADCINEVRAGDDAEYLKPDKRSMGDWLERKNLSPDQVLVIGDQFVDAQLALNIGARALLVRRHSEIPHLGTLSDKDSRAIVIVNSLGDVTLVP